MNKKVLFAILFFSLVVLPIVCNAQQFPTFPRWIRIVFERARAVVDTVFGAVVVVGFVVAGILYLTSAGDTQKMTTAKTALKYAIIGLAVGVGVDIILSLINWIVRNNWSAT